MPIRFFPQKTSFNFIGQRWLGFGLSIAMLLLTAFLLAMKGLNFGIDFTGGIMMDVRTEQPADLAAMRQALDEPELGEVSLQHFGDEREVMIRLQASEETQAKTIERVKTLLAERISPDIDYRQVEFVGPQVGSELIQAGSIALLFAFGAIMLYIWFRFEWQFGIGAIVALIHDTLLTLGFFALLGLEFNLTSIAALLTIIGYSINDSVVIYDRVRENLRKYKKMPLDELLNLSINDTLSRTVITALTTLLALGALVIFGGEVIRGFSLSVLFGVTIGTYSSIFIAAPLLIYVQLRRENAPGIPATSGAQDA